MGACALTVGGCGRPEADRSRWAPGVLPIFCASGGVRKCTIQAAASSSAHSAAGKTEGAAVYALCSCRRCRAAGADLLTAGLLHSELQGERALDCRGFTQGLHAESSQACCKFAQLHRACKQRRGKQVAALLLRLHASCWSVRRCRGAWVRKLAAGNTVQGRLLHARKALQTASLG